MVTSHLAAPPPDAVVIAASRGDAGRAEVAISLAETQYVRTELIFDRASHAYHGHSSVAVTEGDGLRAGDVLSSTAVLSVAIVDSSPIERSTHA